MEVNLLQYGALGAFTFVVLLFLRDIAAERRDRRRERDGFIRLVGNHIEHDRQAKEQLSRAITDLTHCLSNRPCLLDNGRKVAQ